MALKAQSMFEIENQSPCNWDVELYIAEIYTCNYYTPTIPVVAMPNMTTQVNIPNTYPCTACTVSKVRVYDQGGSGYYVEIGYYGCKPQSLSIGDCPIDGLVYEVKYDNNPYHITIAIK